jgi:lauroyl/myristoyl acyltransferase
MEAGLSPAAMARRIAKALEEEIRRRPADWLWIYRRQAWLNPAVLQSQPT